MKKKLVWALQNPYRSIPRKEPPTSGFIGLSRSVIPKLSSFWPPKIKVFNVFTPKSENCCYRFFFFLWPGISKLLFPSTIGTQHKSSFTPRLSSCSLPGYYHSHLFCLFSNLCAETRFSSSGSVGLVISNIARGANEAAVTGFFSHKAKKTATGWWNCPFASRLS